MIKQLTLFTVFLLFVFTFQLTAQNTPTWLRYPSISPDGQTILFNYKGDIYKVPATGGKAIPLTLSDSYEYSAVWSNDGKQIAFASDRYGNFDIFVMPAEGGEAKRLTYHSYGEKPSCFTKDDKNIVFAGNRQDLATNIQFPSGVMAELYSVPVTGGRVSQILSTPAHDAVFSPNGTKLIFHDRKGYENEWRKHHTSAVTRDVWVYDMATREYKQLSQFKGENRNPVFGDNNNDFYYLSEESGSFNVHKSSLSNPTENTKITNFEKNPVRFLSSSSNNTLCFGFDGKIYTLSPEGEPQKVAIQLAYDGRSTLDKIVKVNSKFTEISLAPNGKEFAYIFHGEIFVSSIEKGTTKRITNTPWQERSVSFKPDGRSLVYAAEVNNSWNIYSTSIVRKEEPYFYVSTLLKEEPVIATDQEEFQPAYSPDGKEVAYLENRTTLKVVNLASKESRTILPAKYNYSYADGDQWYQWSPDSKWFLVNFGQAENVMQSEVGLIEASGKGTVRNLTESGYGDYMPMWDKTGKSFIWGTTRKSNMSESLNHSSMDVYRMFLTQKSFDRFNLSKEEFDLLTEQEKKAKEDEKSNEKDVKKSKVKKDTTKVEDIKIDWKNLKDRKSRLTANTSKLYDWVLSKEGDKLYYLTRFEDKYDLWVNDLRKKETKLFAKIGARSVSMEMSDDGKFILVLADGSPKKVTIKDKKVKAINTNGEMSLKQADERAYIFDHCWREVREKFYVEDMQGVDWDFYYKEYKKFLPEINNNYDFTEVLSEMLGELNASHTGSGYRHHAENADKTASLGAIYDYSNTENGLKISEILKGGPLDKAYIKTKAGNIIEKIDGEPITPKIDFYKLLNRKKGKNVLISVSNGKDNWEEIVKPISLGAENQLLYKRWVETRRAEV